MKSSLSHRFFPFLLLCLGIAPLAAACGDRPVAKLEPRPSGELRAEVPIDRNRELDLLFIIDNSRSMKLEQDSLRRNFYRIIDTLRGSSEGLPSLHIGVVTTDLGAGNACLPINPFAGKLVNGNNNCGLDGVYISDEVRSDGARAQNYRGDLADTFACIAQVGDEGCGFEQPLEAMRRVLTENPDTFHRPNAYLGVILITDEDDCSTRDLAMFNAPNGSLTSEFGPTESFRCFEYGVVCDGNANPRAPGLRTNCRPNQNSAYLFNPTEYIAFLKGYAPYPGQVFIAAIDGPDGPVNVINGPRPGTSKVIAELEFLCPATPGGRQVAEANPPIRLRSFYDAFGSSVTRHSICNEDLGPAVQKIANFIETRLSPCLPERPLDLNPSTAALEPECNVEEHTQLPGSRMQRRPLPPCPSNGGTSVRDACYLLEQKEECEGSGLALAVQYPDGVTVPPGSRAIARCLAR